MLMTHTRSNWPTDFVSVSKETQSPKKRYLRARLVRRKNAKRSRHLTQQKEEKEMHFYRGRWFGSGAHQKHLFSFSGENAAWIFNIHSACVPVMNLPRSHCFCTTTVAHLLETELQSTRCTRTPPLPPAGLDNEKISIHTHKHTKECKTDAKTCTAWPKNSRQALLFQCYHEVERERENL